MMCCLTGEVRLNPDNLDKFPQTQRFWVFFLPRLAFMNYDMLRKQDRVCVQHAHLWW